MASRASRVTANHRDALQVVVICLPHWLHEQAAMDAAEAGKDIFIEKPLSVLMAGCDRIIEAAHHNNITLMPARTQRYYQVVARMKEILDSRGLGELIMAVDTWYKPLKLDARPLWMLERKMGGEWRSWTAPT